jgi:hypothetical protein
MSETIITSLHDVRAALPRLTKAVSEKPVQSSGGSFVSGGEASYELVSLSALSLLQDIRREVDEHEQQLRLTLGHGWEPAADLDTALLRLGVALQATESRPECAAERLAALRALAGWARRAGIVLRDLRAPYPLLFEDGSPVRCPVVEWVSDDDGAQPCGAVLWVHRHADTGSPNVIACRRSLTHAWASGPQWLQLGALLGGIA